MKRLVLFICTILCANVLWAQTYDGAFYVEDLIYAYNNSNQTAVVYGYDYENPPTNAVIYESVIYQGVTYNVVGIEDYAFFCTYTENGWEYLSCSSLTSVTIPNSITSIGELAFGSCSSLTSVTIPNSVTSIGFCAFWSCSSLTSITIPNSVTSIGEGAFLECSSLTSVTIGNGVTSIYANTFALCSNLTSITIGNSVTSIEGAAFLGCSSLTTLNFNAINCNDFNSSANHPFYNIPITTINIGNSVLRIPNRFASGLSSLTSVNIGNSVMSIGEWAFYRCSSLTSVTIPNSVNSIGHSAFVYCSSLTSVNIGNSVTSIDAQTFAYCSNLTSVNIGNSVTFIGDYAFNSCSSLTSITIPNGVYSVGSGAFKYCSSLISVDIGNSVSSIGSGAFNWCSSLTSVTLPNSITSIGGVAFSGCSGLTSVTCLANTPPSLVETAFYDTPSNKILNVNCGLKDDYILSWGNEFDSNNIFEIYPYNVEAIVNNEAFGSIEVENNCSFATFTATANACYEFVSWNDGNTDNPRTINLVSDTSFTALFEEIEFDTELSATICQGQTYTDNGFNVSEAGVYTQNLTSVNGCDSIVTLNLSVSPIYNTDLVASICDGEVYNENGFNVNEAGVYTQTLQTLNGCDSIVTLTLSVNPVFNTNLSAFICEGETYTENGFNVSEAGVYTQSLQSVNGCDSIITLTLNVNPIFHTELSATIYEGSVYNDNGFNVSEAGTYTQNLTTANGCDSIVTLTLNINSVIYTSLTETICEGQTYTDNGFNVSEAGVYTQNLTSVNGCDSIVTLNLSVNPIYNTELVASICDGEVYNENGFNVSEAGVYSQTLQAINGCDSIVTLTLSVNPIFNTDLSAFICEGQTYSENGFNVSEAGVYTQSLQSVSGCDSIVTLTLNVNPIINTELSATICEGSVYNDNGFNVSEAGTYTQNLTTANGCDSIVTLTLTVLPSYNTNLTATICEGSELNISGFHVTEGGVYTQTYTAVNGCDSIVTLTVTELPTIHTNLTLTICEGTSLNFSGFNVSEAGVYTQNLTSVNGCDSIVTLTVTVNPTFDTTINATINAGETYAEFGFNESESGTYVQNLQTEAGCDSTITLNLTVNSSLYDVAELTEITFYPNPTSGKVTFSKEIEKIEVIDNIGKIVMRFFDTNEINIDTLPSGAYYLRLTIEDKTIMRKVIKE